MSSKEEPQHEAAATPEPPDYKKAMLYHSDRADNLSDEVSKLAADNLALRVEVERLKASTAKSFGEACGIVAKNHGLGLTLVTGHKVQYFIEAHQIAQAEQLKACRDEIKELKDENNNQFNHLAHKHDENLKLRAELLKQSHRTQSWYSHEVRELLGLFKQPYIGAGFPKKI